MADHVRKQIRDWVANKLNTYAGKTWGDVYESRTKNIPEAKLPVLCLYTKIESAEITTMSTPRRSSRELILTIEIYAKLNAEYDDFIDEACKQIEQALTADFQLEGLAKDIHLDGVEIEFSQEGDKPVVTCDMNWTVEYNVLETTPDVAI